MVGSLYSCSIENFLGGYNIPFINALLYYIDEELLFLLSELCPSLPVGPYLSAVQLWTV